MIEDNSDRKIAVIFVTDVVGYSKAIENNEKQTLKNLKECRNILDNLILKHKGKIFNTAGDSVLAEFSSAVSAIECATLFQTKIRDRNSSAKDLEIMEFRIGINIGDVVIDGKNLYGEGVNIAARLESFAQPNGLSISKSLFDLIEGKTQNKFRDLGIQKIKNNSIHTFDLLNEGILKKRKIKKNYNYLYFISLGLLLTIIVSLSTILIFNNDNKGIKNIDYNNTMLIAPFEIRAPDNSYDYLSQGILEYLVANLTGVKDFKVLSSSFSNEILQKDYSDKEILQEFDANFILRGSLQILNDNIRMNLTLKDIAQDKQIWTQTKTTELENIFDTQDEIVIDILGFLGLGVRDTSKATVFTSIDKPKELQLILKWLEIQRGFSKDVWYQMADISNQLYEMNPDGLVHNTIKAWDYHWKITWGVSQDVKSDFQKGIQYANTVIDLQKDSLQKIPDPYLAKAFLYMRQGNVEEAMKNANLGKKYIINNPESWGGLGVIYHFNNEHEQAIEALEIYQSQTIKPNDLFMEILGWAYTFENNYEKARSTWEYIANKDKHYQKKMKSKIYLSLSYLSSLEGKMKKSQEYFDLHDALQHKASLETFSRGAFGKVNLMKKPLKFWKKMGLK
jgi:adenylate cyclase